MLCKIKGHITVDNGIYITVTLMPEMNCQLRLYDRRHTL